MYWCSYYSRACGGAHVQRFLMVCLLIYMRLADFARNVQIAGSWGSEIHILFNLPSGPCGGERGAALGINRLFILTLCLSMLHAYSWLYIAACVLQSSSRGLLQKN